MRAAIAEAFPRWARDPEIYAVVIASARERAFCAGGDLRETTDWGRNRRAEAVRSLAEEYALSWLLECFTKPTVSLIDGVVMGSGVGISLYGTHRVAGERYRFAMPETGIGLFPDDGVSWAFARMPDEIGMYLALTGRAIGRADAYRLGLATHCIPARALRRDQRAASPTPTRSIELLDDRHEDPGPGELEALRAAIARCFCRRHGGGHHRAPAGRARAAAAWAEGSWRTCRARSPTSLKITHRHVRSARDLDLRETLHPGLPARLPVPGGPRLLRGRARRADRSRPGAQMAAGAPRGCERGHGRGLFRVAGAGELELPSRAEMQAGAQPERSKACCR